MKQHVQEFMFTMQELLYNQPWSVWTNLGNVKAHLRAFNVHDNNNADNDTWAAIPLKWKH